MYEFEVREKKRKEELAKADEMFKRLREEKDKYPKITAINWQDLLICEFRAREPILAPVITLGSLNMLYAPRGIGKTHVALGISHAAACGKDFWSWKAVRPFHVLYIDGEMPGESIQQRAIKISEAGGIPHPPEMLRVITRDKCDNGAPDLATIGGQLSIEDDCMQAELIVIDNLSCLVRGKGNENEADSWLSVQEWAMRMRSLNKAVLFVHHTGKNGDQRGTSKKEDVLDVSIALKRPPDYSEEEGARFEVRFTKSRHLTGDQAEPFIAHLKEDETTSRQFWEITNLGNRRHDQVRELHDLGLSQREIAAELGIPQSNVCRILKKYSAQSPKPLSQIYD